MARVPVRLHLEQRRPDPFARTLRGRAHGLLDRIHVLTVDDASGNAVRRGAIRQVVDRRGAVEAAVFAVDVVLDHVDDGQLPDGRQVQPLVERTDVRGAVPEYAHADLAA